MVAVPGSHAAWKGMRSFWASEVASLEMIGRDSCGLTCMLLWPGKCFADGAIPALVRPRQTAVTYFETSSGTLQIHNKPTFSPNHFIKCIPSPKDHTPAGRNVRWCDDGSVNKKNEPMTGFRKSLFTSPTGLYAQFILVCFSSSADASVMRSTTSGEPAAASAIAPGLSMPGGSHQCNEDYCLLHTDN